jgi:hypothetical protein
MTAGEWLMRIGGTCILLGLVSTCSTKGAAAKARATPARRAAWVYWGGLGSTLLGVLLQLIGSLLS